MHYSGISLQNYLYVRSQFPFDDGWVNTWAGTVRHLRPVLLWVLPKTPAVPAVTGGSVAHGHFVHVNAILTFIPTIRKNVLSMSGWYVKLKLNRCSVVVYYYLPPARGCATAADEITHSNYIACKSITAPMGPEMQLGPERSGRTERHELSSLQEGKKHAHGTQVLRFPCGKGLSLFCLLGHAAAQQPFTT